MSVDRLKPVISSVPVVPGVPPVRGWPRLKPASTPGPPVKDRPPVKKVTFSPVKKVRFSPVPAKQLRRNPRRTVQNSPPLSAVLRPHLLGGVTVATANLTSTFGTVCSLVPPAKPYGDLRGITLICKAQSESRPFVFPFQYRFYHVH